MIFLLVNVNPIALGQPFQDFGRSVIFSYDSIHPTGAKVKIKKLSDSTFSFGGIQMRRDPQKSPDLVPGLSKCVHKAWKFDRHLTICDVIIGPAKSFSETFRRVRRWIAPFMRSHVDKELFPEVVKSGAPSSEHCSKHICHMANKDPEF